MSDSPKWETPNVAQMLKRKTIPESAGMSGVTTSANVGAFAVPLGVPLRRPNVDKLAIKSATYKTLGKKRK